MGVTTHHLPACRAWGSIGVVVLDVAILMCRDDGARTRTVRIIVDARSIVRISGIVSGDVTSEESEHHMECSFLISDIRIHIPRKRSIFHQPWEMTSDGAVLRCGTNALLGDDVRSGEECAVVDGGAVTPEEERFLRIRDDQVEGTECGRIQRPERLARIVWGTVGEGAGNELATGTPAHARRRTIAIRKCRDDTSGIHTDPRAAALEILRGDAGERSFETMDARRNRRPFVEFIAVRDAEDGCVCSGIPRERNGAHGISFLAAAVFRPPFVSCP